MHKKAPYSKLAGAFTLAAGSFLTITKQAFAQIINPVIGPLGDDPAQASSGAIFAEYFVHIWNVLIQVGALAVLIYFLWGAIEWITAGGDSGKLQTARNRMLQSAIGLLILVSSFVIVSFIGYVLFGDSFDILELTFPSPNS